MANSSRTRSLLNVARNIVNAILEGGVDSGAYALLDIKKRQAFNDTADDFVVRLITDYIGELLTETDLEWAVQSQTFVDGPWDRIEPMSRERAQEIIYRAKVNSDRFDIPVSERVMFRKVGEWKRLDND